MLNISSIIFGFLPRSSMVCEIHSELVIEVQNRARVILKAKGKLVGNGRSMGF